LRVLALETSTRQASIALLETTALHSDGGVDLITASDVPMLPRTAESLIPFCRDKLNAVSWTPADLDLICISIGPGSFTGLRIGVVAAKTLAYAVGAEVAALNSLQVVAAQADFEGDVIAVSDAQRSQLFSQSFGSIESGRKTLTEPSIVDFDSWLEQDRTRCGLVGEGLQRIRDRLSTDAIISDESTWHPRAETVGRLGIEAYRAGERDDVWALKPRYIRASAAEEKISRNETNNPG
jgi:tRNA threonylcarbamoyladenosine biosynthesis protein TsaB